MKKILKLQYNQTGATTMMEQKALPSVKLGKKDVREYTYKVGEILRTNHQVQVCALPAYADKLDHIVNYWKDNGCELLEYTATMQDIMINDEKQKRKVIMATLKHIPEIYGD